MPFESKFRVWLALFVIKVFVFRTKYREKKCDIIFSNLAEAIPLWPLLYTKRLENLDYTLRYGNPAGRRTVTWGSRTWLPYCQVQNIYQESYLTSWGDIRHCQESLQISTPPTVWPCQECLHNNPDQSSSKRMQILNARISHLNIPRTGFEI